MLRKLVFFAFLAVAAACMAGKRVVAAPQFAVSTNPNFVVEGVELGDTATLLHCALHLPAGFRYSIDAGSSLKVGAERLALRRAEGITPGRNVRMDTAKCSRFTLVFPPVAADAETVDFIEGESEGDFQVFGISLAEGRKPHYEGMPESVRAAALSPADSGGGLPVPQWKYGKATIRGRLYGYRPEMNTKINLFPGLAIDPRRDNLIETAVAPDGTFCIEVPVYATCQTVALRLNGIGCDVVVRQGGTCEVYADLVEGSHSVSPAEWAATGQGRLFGLNRLYFAGDMAGVNNRLADPAMRKLMDSCDFRMAEDNRPADGALYSPQDYCAKVMQWHADNLKAADSICPSRSAREVMRAVQTYHTVYSLMWREGFVEADAEGRTLFDGCIFDAYRQLGINDMMMAYSGSFDTMANCFQYILNGDTAYFNKVSGIYRSASLTAVDSAMQAVRAFDREYRAGVFDWTDGPLFDLMLSVDFSERMNRQTPFADEQLKLLASQPNAAIRDYYLARNEELKAALAARKGNGTYTMHAAPAGSGDEALAAIAAEYAGRAVLVDFWGTWCLPCRSAIKRFEEGKARLMRQGVEFVYITDDKSPEDEWGNMASGISGHHYRLTGAQTANLYERYKLSGWPSYLILDKDGECVYSRTGFRENEITNKLKSIIQ